jgi:hypothetical protein
MEHMMSLVGSFREARLLMLQWRSTHHQKQALTETFLLLLLLLLQCCLLTWNI